MSDGFVEILDDPVATKTSVAPTSAVEIYTTTDVSVVELETVAFLEVMVPGPQGIPGPEGPPGGGGGGGGANLTVTRDGTSVTVVSDSGTDAVIPVADTTNAGVMSEAHFDKLAGITAGATPNSSDAVLLARANHTGTQTSSTISDFTEAAQDAIAALLASGTQVSLSYNDAGNALTISATGADAEAMRDAVGAAMVGVGLVTVTVNDGADTITISTTATANSSDATLLARANHTGTQSADTLTDGTTNKAFLATERTKLSTVEARANHTGTQTASTISDFTEAAQDAIASLLTSGTQVSLSYNDAGNSLQISATGADAEAMRDAVGAAMVGTGLISVVVNDGADTITISTTATANSSDATLLDRGNHTGSQAESTITNLVTDLAARMLLKNNAQYSLTTPLTDQVASIVIEDDNSSTTSWANRWEWFFKVFGGSSKLVTWINEYGELRGTSAKSNTVAARWFGRTGTGDTAHTGPVIEIQDDRTTRTSMWSVEADGKMNTAADFIQGPTGVVFLPTYIDPGSLTGKPAGFVIRT